MENFKYIRLAISTLRDMSSNGLSIGTNAKELLPELEEVLKQRSDLLEFLQENYRFLNLKEQVKAVKLINRVKNYKCLEETPSLPNPDCQKLTLLYGEVVKLSSKQLQELLEKMYTQNSRELFDKIMCKKGSVVFYKNDEPIESQEKENISHIDELYEFLSKWDSILKMTGEDVIINSNGIVVI